MSYFDYYLTAETLEALLTDLRNVGFECYDENFETGEKTTRNPKPMEVISVSGLGDCVYLEHILEEPPTYDEEGDELTPPIYSSLFHANVRMRKETLFQTSMNPNPSSPSNRWL